MRWISILLLVAAPLGAQSMSGVSVGQPVEWLQASFEGSIELEWYKAAGGCGPTESEVCWYWRLQDMDGAGWYWGSDAKDAGTALECDTFRGTALIDGDVADRTDYADAYLEDISGRGTVMYQEFTADDPTTTIATSRLEYGCNYDPTVPDTLNSGYLAFDLYLQDDLDTQCCGGDCAVDDSCWRYLAELWEADSEHRITLTLNRVRSGTNEWRLRITHGQLTPTVSSIWSVDDDAEVTFGQWQRYELEWESSTPSSGHMKLWVNGVLELEKTASQIRESDNFMLLDFMAIYTNSFINETNCPSCDSNASWQRIDNVVLCGSRAECG